MPDTPTYLDLTGLTTYDGLIKAEISGKIDIGGRAGKIPYGNVDSTSTATAFTATVDGLTELTDGTTVMLHNGVVTSASGFTVNVNGLGAKKCYNNMTNATQDTTIFNASYTMLFVYSTSLDSGNGGWWIYRGYDANTNTIGYQLRTNSTVRNVSDTARYYKLYFTSADGTMWVPASVNSTNNATSARPVNQRPIDPFGPIVYTSAYTNYAAGANLAAGTIWEQYALVLGYSFNRTGAALTLTAERPVYVKCAPQAAGGVIMDADEPIVQALPSTKDGKVYIYLGLAYDATHIELQIWHPVYWHDGTGIRLWTGAESGGGPEPSSTTPAMDGTAAVGTATTYARADHVHPTDTSRQATLVSGTNIKAINGTSLLGSGNLSIRELPAVTSADNGKVLMVVDGRWMATTLPVATDSQYGVVMVDGTTITAAGGVISTAGGSTASEVTVTLTNPHNTGEFRRVVVSESDTPTGETTDLGTITSPTGSGTYTVEKSYLQVTPFGVGAPWIDESSCTCTGGVAFDSSFDGTGIFLVTGDGTVTISGLDYDG